MECRKGSVLGLMLFLIYINDLVDVFGSNLTVKLFADDVKIYVNICDIASSSDLQMGLNALCEWASMWQLNISINKCAVLHLGRTNLSQEYSINNVCLPHCDAIRDLGILIDSNLRFSAHYSNIIARAHQRACLIIRCFKSRDPTLLFRAFKVYVRPTLEYCSPVWSPVYKTDIVKIENIQRRFTKKLRGCKNLSYIERLQLLGAQTLELRRLKQDLCIIYKIINKLIDVDSDTFFTFSSYKRTRGNSFKLLKPVCINNTRAFNFSCRNVNCWNSLPDYCVCAESFNIFKSCINGTDFSKFLYIA